ncbi:MAG: 50S ribosomal protein L11 methyltransferase [Bacteroidales bacterium]|nr:50S ribosomal protein L11 methyltransferase [Bacteroidales bacterium]
MQYVEITCQISDTLKGNEIMIALLADMGCDSFVEYSEGVKAYIPKKDFSPAMLDELQNTASAFDFEVLLQYDDVEEKDWNAEWEKSYSPVLIDGQCYIRAPFHAVKDNVKYEILIEPKMSFGTAHHPTTAQLISYLLQEDCERKRILDMGSGTGVLAILAAKKGASYVLAIDNDNWAYQNCVENVQCNGLKDIIEVIHGDASSVKNAPFDMILANINRNVLLQDMHVYANALKQGGILYLSGFYLHPDLDLLTAEAAKYHMGLLSYKKEKDWVAAKLQKK